MVLGEARQSYGPWFFSRSNAASKAKTSLAMPEKHGRTRSFGEVLSKKRREDVLRPTGAWGVWSAFF